VIRIILAAVLIVGAGLVHGTWTHRWGASAAVKDLAARMESLPTVLGDWKMTESYEISPAEIAMTGATGHVSRQYTNTSRGVSVSLLLLGGLPGKISTHPPDVCYRGTGYMLEAPSPYVCRYGSGGRDAELRTMAATRQGTSPSSLRIFWGWNDSKGWSAPAEPRWQFGAAGALCKLYVVRETSAANVDAASDPCTDFLSVLLPELDRILFSVQTAGLTDSPKH
jgi:hypothetical protein